MRESGGKAGLAYCCACLRLHCLTTTLASYCFWLSRWGAVQ